MIIYFFSQNNNNNQYYNMSWQPLGNLPNAPTGYYYFGECVSLNADGTIMAVGSPNTGPYPGNVTSTPLTLGVVVVYQLIDTNWVQIGQTINDPTLITPINQAAGNYVSLNPDKFGKSVSLSSDGTILAVGNPSAVNKGRAYIYTYNGSSWSLQTTFNGAQTYELFGDSVCLNSAGDVLAVGIPGKYNNVKPLVGSVNVYENVANQWILKGSPIISPINVSGTYFGNSISLDGSGNTLVVGAQNADLSSSANVGCAVVYQFASNAWTNQFLTYGENANDNFGAYVSISEDGNRFAVGATGSDVSGNNSGMVEIYTLVTSQTGDLIWSQQAVITGPNDYSAFGGSLSFNSDGSLLAVGAPNYYVSGVANAGRVTIYQETSNAWSQIGEPIYGQTANANLGKSVSLNSNGTVVAFGAPGAPTNGIVAIYEYPAPTITSVSPSDGSPDGGTNVTITGEFFTSGSSVTFGGVAASNIIVNSSNNITCETPASQIVEQVDVVVTTSYGSATSSNAFSYLVVIFPPPPDIDLPPQGGGGIISVAVGPLITSVSPSDGSPDGGTNVTITGEYFTSGSSVTFGGVAASNIIVNSSNNITCETPASQIVGPVNVVVTTTYGNIGTSNAFTYISPPAITNITPYYGSTVGGTSVTITGEYFTSGSSVTFGGVAASNIIVDASGLTITCDTPASQIDGVVDIVVTTLYGSATSSNAFTYISPPIITSLSPTSGNASTSTSVLILGSSFTDATSVTFGGTEVINFSVHPSGNTIQCDTPYPVSTDGSVNVVVTTPYGVGTAIGAFYYILNGSGAIGGAIGGAVTTPTITSVSPTSGSTSGGTTVTILGTNFTNVTSVTFGGIDASNIIVDASGLSITCQSPQSQIDGSVNIVVIYSAGSIQAGTFDYQDSSPVPVSNICFPKGTPIFTNQGKIPIEKINPQMHAIRNRRIVAVTKTVTHDKHLVCFEKDSIENNIPSQQTVISKNHQIMYKGKMMKAKEFVGKFENVYKIKYTGEVLYNVLMENHDKMVVNNLICETLHPENGIAILYNIFEYLNEDEKIMAINKVNKHAMKK